MIAIIDYKAGNLASVKKAFDHLGVEATVGNDPEQICQAEKLVLPGVGHFATTQALSDTGLRDSIVGSIRRGVPFLGICVGMQWLLASSEEAPGVAGLGLWSGKCASLPASVKSPHVGWNSLRIAANKSRLLRGIPDGSFVYFTHSYAAPLLEATVAECDYGNRFSAAIELENVFGVQFHPEKSGAAGLEILSNFCQC